MFRDSALEIVKYSDFLALTEPRKYDLKTYKCRKKLKNVSEKYIDDRYAVWKDSCEKILDFIEKTDEKIKQYIHVDNVIGTEEELNESFVELLNKQNLSVEDGFEIRRHVGDKIKSGELNDRSFFTRVKYLLEH